MEEGEKVRIKCGAKSCFFYYIGGVCLGSIGCPLYKTKWKKAWYKQLCPVWWISLPHGEMKFILVIWLAFLGGCPGFGAWEAVWTQHPQLWCWQFPTGSHRPPTWHYFVAGFPTTVNTSLNGCVPDHHSHTAGEWWFHYGQPEDKMGILQNVIICSTLNAICCCKPLITKRAKLR